MMTVKSISPTERTELFHNQNHALLAARKLKVSVWEYSSQCQRPHLVSFIAYNFELAICLAFVLPLAYA